MTIKKCSLCNSNLTDLEAEKCGYCLQLQEPSQEEALDLLREIDNRFDRARRTLVQFRHTDSNSITGWYHHLDATNKVGISSTAYALHAFSLLNPRDPGLLRIAEGILNHPERITIKPTSSSGRGGMYAWPMQSYSDVALVEPTCYVLQQLFLAGLLDSQDKRAIGAIEWIFTQQLTNNAWGPSIGHSENVYVTALVCQLLRQFGYDKRTEKLKLGMQWLEGARNIDGGWGKGWRDEKSNAWCTAHAILALYEDEKAPDPNQVPGVEWLRKNTKMWSSLVVEEYEVKSVKPGSGKALYEFQPLPIVLIALDRAGVRPLAPDVFEATKLLVSLGEDGTWIYPVSNRKTIFNLCHAVQGMWTTRERFKNVEIYRAVARLTLPKFASKPNPQPSSVANKWKKHAILLSNTGGYLSLFIAITTPESWKTIQQGITSSYLELSTNHGWTAIGLSLLSIATALKRGWRVPNLVGILSGIAFSYLFIEGRESVNGLIGSMAGAGFGFVLSMLYVKYLSPSSK